MILLFYTTIRYNPMRSATITPKHLFAVITFATSILAQASPLSPQIVNPSNGHIYQLLQAATWKDSEAEAISLGGHLATIRNQAEEDWVFKTFGGYEGKQRLLWIGLSDTTRKFHFSWSSGESVSYTRWAPGEPNNVGEGEDFVAIFYPNHGQANKWNDWSDRKTDPIGLPMNGVVEIIPKETTHNSHHTMTLNPNGAVAPVNPVAPANPAPEMVAVEITPSITITNDSGSIKLQWALSTSGHVLEATSNLSESFTQFGYSETTNLEKGVINVTITNPVPQMFFRLRKL